MHIPQTTSLYPATEAPNAASRSGKQPQQDSDFSAVLSERQPASIPDEHSKTVKEAEATVPPDDDFKEEAEDAVSYIVAIIPYHTQTQEAPADITAELEPQTGISMEDSCLPEVQDTNQSIQASSDNSVPVEEPSTAPQAEGKISLDQNSQWEKPETPSFVSILEGNNSDTDIIPRQTAGETARMPHTATPEEAESLVHETENSPSVKTDDNLCPLENENESPKALAPQKTSADAESSSSSGNEKSEQDKPALTAKEMPTQQVVDISPEKAAASSQLQNATIQNTAMQDAAMQDAAMHGAAMQNSAMQTPAPESPVPEFTQHASPSPVQTNELFDVMVQKMEMSNVSGSDYLEIQLKPEHLGKVTIQLSMSDGGLQAKINADSMEVRTMLNGQIGQLTESLAEKGVKISNIEVVYTGVSENTYGQSKQKGDSSQEGQIRSRIQRLQRLNGYAASTAPVWGESGAALTGDGTSSVEYRA